MLTVLIAAAVMAQPLGGRAPIASGKPPSRVVVVLPTPPAPSSECAGTLTGTKGEVLTISRTSSAYCTKSDGTMVLLAADTPRVGKAGASVGLMQEPAATNIVLRSEEFDNATWSKIGSTTAPTVTANAASCPWGGTTAERIDFPAVSGVGAYSLVRQTIPVSAASRGSIWMKAVSGSAAVYLSNGGTTAGASALCNSTDATWTRCSVAIADLGATDYFDIGTNKNLSGQGDTAAASVYVCGAQTETGPVETSYIATAGTSATRGVERGHYSLPASKTLVNASLSGTLTGSATTTSSNSRLMNPLGGSSSGTHYLVAQFGSSGGAQFLCAVAGTGGSAVATAPGAPNGNDSFSCSLAGATLVACLNGSCTSASHAVTGVTISTVDFGWIRGIPTDRQAHGGLKNACFAKSARGCL